MNLTASSIPGGTWYHPGDEGWDRARTPWNLAIDQRPVAVVEARDGDDIAAAVHLARARGWNVAPQGTGHGAAALAQATDPATVLLRTHLMRDVTIDPDRGLAHVQAGARWGDVVDAAGAHGMTALAGSAPDVGVVGYLLGGGLSWLGRGRGLACYDMTAAAVVTGTGDRIRADAAHDRELLWSLRGGGSACGVVVTEIELALHRMTTVYAGMMLFPLVRAREVLTAYARWTRTAPETATTAVRLLRFPPVPQIPEPLRGGAFVGVNGAIDAPAEEADRMLAPLRDLDPQIDTFTVMPTTDLQSINLDPPDPAPALGDGMNITGLTDEVIDALLSVAGPEVDDCPLLLVDLRHLGGALGRPDPRGGALASLAGDFTVFTTGVCPTAQAAAAVAAATATAQLRAVLQPWQAERDFLNFRESPAAGVRVHRRTDLTRIHRIGRRMDPGRVMRGHQPLTVG